MFILSYLLGERIPLNNANWKFAGTQMQQTDIMKTKVPKVYINSRYNYLFCVFGICVCSVYIMYANHRPTNDIIPMDK